ncbi:nuclear poly(A) polymerase 3 isoform X1 [Senna tora]|uniref:Nuclear poly(A) polymerase 3 isoform X1 n=1 Tax=Senna tora TaxID=362788 RepID=A0A834X7G8_9FABA|nr:nuclear poly(A) polymerase 3 isoform X1 [Senna tora]
MKFKQVVSSWIKKGAWNHRLPKCLICITSATVLTFGSYGLGVHSPKSDIDALCVAPLFTSMVEDFFVRLHGMLERRPEVMADQGLVPSPEEEMRRKFSI